MARYLALDIGTRRTGVAFADDDTGVPLPLDTIQHTSFEELEKKVLDLIAERSVDHVILGLPLLLSGEEGKQSAIVRAFASRLENSGISPQFVDERYTTPPQKGSDSDATAAFRLLETFF